jgi:uncharacterized protein YdhG (YjbR/CyaY superfamily)
VITTRTVAACRPSQAVPAAAALLAITDGNLTSMGSVDEYLGTLDGATRSAYRHIHDVAVAEVPDADQGTSYGMAALIYRGKPLLGFKAARDHLSLFPFSPSAVDAVRGALDGYDVSKGTIRFAAEHPLPDDVVRLLVRSRAAEIASSPKRSR